MLHIAPGPLAGGELRQALRRAGRADEVLACCDDLSCGPIDPDNPSVRLDWWRQYDSVDDHDGYMVVFGQIPAFWHRAMSTGERLVVWFGRHSAMELAFFSAWAEKLGDRPYDIVDENAPFRVMSDAGLVSAPIDHFDSWLLERATTDWRKAARVVGDSMGNNMEPYIQVGDLMLLTRIVAQQGALEADGDPWDMTTCRLRLAL